MHRGIKYIDILYLGQNWIPFTCKKHTCQGREEHKQGVIVFMTFMVDFEMIPSKLYKKYIF